MTPHITWNTVSNLRELVDSCYIDVSLDSGGLVSCIENSTESVVVLWVGHISSRAKWTLRIKSKLLIYGLVLLETTSVDVKFAVDTQRYSSRNLSRSITTCEVGSWRVCFYSDLVVWGSMEFNLQRLGDEITLLLVWYCLHFLCQVLRP